MIFLRRLRLLLVGDQRVECRPPEVERRGGAQAGKRIGQREADETLMISLDRLKRAIEDNDSQT